MFRDINRELQELKLQSDADIAIEDIVDQIEGPPTKTPDAISNLQIQKDSYSYPQQRQSQKKNIQQNFGSGDPVTEQTKLQDENFIKPLVGKYLNDPLHDENSDDENFNVHLTIPPGEEQVYRNDENINEDFNVY